MSDGGELALTVAKDSCITAVPWIFEPVENEGRGP